MGVNETYIAQGKEHFMNTYAQLPIVLQGGSGCRVVDMEGREYLDFVGGIAVNALGYGDLKLKSALKTVIDGGLTHCSNLYWNPYAIRSAALLSELSGLERVFFCNSGAEANEAAIKLARKYAYRKKGPDAARIISMRHSFHGRTYAAVTATGQDKYHAGFAPLMPEIVYAEFNNSASVAALLDERTCAVIVEPVQGEGGIRPAEKGFLQELRRMCDAVDALLIFDEVQCGMGRSGRPFAYQAYDVLPDAATMAKGLGAGIPIGALAASERAASAFVPGDHASTFGGNLLACAAAEVVLSCLKEGALLEQVEARAAQLHDGLMKLQRNHPALISDVRGLGLMQGIELTVDAAPVISRVLAEGVLLVAAGKKVIRFVPPLTITAEDIEILLTVLDRCLL